MRSGALRGGVGRRGRGGRRAELEEGAVRRGAEEGAGPRKGIERRGGRRGEGLEEGAEKEVEGRGRRKGREGRVGEGSAWWKRR